MTTCVLQGTSACVSAVNAAEAAATGRHRGLLSSTWLHSLDLADLPESYHPTAAGQSSGYLPAFAAAVLTAEAG